jgi:hypothetical protein
MTRPGKPTTRRRDACLGEEMVVLAGMDRGGRHSLTIIPKTVLDGATSVPLGTGGQNCVGA